MMLQSPRFSAANRPQKGRKQTARRTDALCDQGFRKTCLNECGHFAGMYGCLMFCYHQCIYACVVLEGLNQSCISPACLFDGQFPENHFFGQAKYSKNLKKIDVLGLITRYLPSKPYFKT